MPKINPLNELLTWCLAAGHLIFSIGSAEAQSVKAEIVTADAITAKALEVTKKLEGLDYSRHGPDLRDCSGIFHQVLSGIRDSCPHFEGPEAGSSRTTGGIAKWYAAKNQLVLVRKALRQDELIQPGTVLFYGEQNKTYRALSQEKTLHKISHLGIVVSVERNRDGSVAHYKLFHGRRPGRSASVTYHGRSPSSKKDPPLGNGGQQWIAAARLCEQGSCACLP